MTRVTQEQATDKATESLGFDALIAFQKTSARKVNDRRYFAQADDKKHHSPLHATPKITH
jgi:hypothetical protein